MDINLGLIRDAATGPGHPAGNIVDPNGAALDKASDREHYYVADNYISNQTFNPWSAHSHLYCHFVQY